MEPDRRQTDPHLKALCGRVTSLEQTLTAHLKEEEQVQARFTADLASNTEITAKVERNTAAIVEAWQSLEGAFKVLHVVGRTAKYVGYILTAAITAWVIIKAILTGTTPPAPGGTP